MAPLEIERKFLIKNTDTLDKACTERIDIVQTYLTRDDPAVQRRVRSMTINGDTKYFYTEKRFISASVREENEREISRREYDVLIAQEDKALRPVTKTRRIAVYEGQRFEIDSYPFSSELATMELELESTEQEISLPPFADIIKEVTGDGRYSNAALAKSGQFPEDI